MVRFRVRLPGSAGALETGREDVAVRAAVLFDAEVEVVEGDALAV